MDMPLEPTDLDPQETREWLDAMQAVVAHEAGARALPAGSADRPGPRWAPPRPTPRPTSTRFRSRPRRPSPATPVWNCGWTPICAGTPWPWCCAPARPRAWAGTSPPMRRRPRYETGYRHFFRAATPEFLGDMLYIQGHSAPGIYARAYLEGRLSEDELDRFRREIGGGGLASYPHPRTMPGFWQFPTVSMGLGPLMAAYQARYMRYLEDRELIPAQGRKVWGFLGDGEQDQPETLAAVAMAGREKLDNLIFVVNCNLQRLDGPVRGNAKIMQELESVYRGAGWNVIKVVWGGDWDALLAQDHDGRLRRRMMECVDGEYQVFARRRLCARAFLRRGSGAAGARGAPERRADRRAASRRPRSGQGIRGLCRAAPHRQAHRHPGQDGQGLRHGRGRRGRQHQPPAEEDGGSGRARVPRPLLHPGARRSAGADSVHRRRPAAPSRPISTRPSSARAAICRAVRPAPARWPRRRWRPSPRCSRAARAASSRPRWPSCGCWASC